MATSRTRSGSGSVSNKDIYEAVENVEKKLGLKIDANQLQGHALDVKMAGLVVQVSNVCDLAGVAIKKVEAVETEVDELKLANAKSNKIAAAIAAGVSGAANILWSVWQSNR